MKNYNIECEKINQKFLSCLSGSHEVPKSELKGKEDCSDIYKELMSCVKDQLVQESKDKKEKGFKSLDSRIEPLKDQEVQESELKMEEGFESLDSSIEPLKDQEVPEICIECLYAVQDDSFLKKVYFEVVESYYIESYIKACEIIEFYPQLSVLKDVALKLFLIESSLIKNEYVVLFVFLIVSTLLAIIIISASYFLAKQNPESEKLSAYECGFEPYEDTRHIFDVRFCVIAILYIIFDIELMFLIPWCVSISKLDLLSFWVMMDFLTELSVGFFYIWYVKALNWN